MADDEDRSEVPRFAEEFWEWWMTEYPEYATYVGYHQYGVGLDRFNEEIFFKRQEFCKDLLKRLSEIDATKESRQNQVTLFMLKHYLQIYIDGIKYAGYLISIHYKEGAHRDFKERVIPRMKFECLKDYEIYVKRLKDFPQQIQEVMDFQMEGVKRGIVHHERALAHTIEDVIDRDLNLPVEDSVYYTPFKGMPDTILEPERSMLKKEGLNLVAANVYGSLEKLKEHMRESYFPHLRKVISVSSLPGGLELYKAQLRFHCDSDISPEEMFKLGNDELKTVQDKVHLLMKEHKFEGSYREFLSYCQKLSGSQLAKTPEEVCEAFRRTLVNKIRPKLPKYFKNLPNQPVNIEAMPDKIPTTFAMYNPPTQGHNVPGTLFVCPHHSEIKNNAFVTLTLHELEPGHHLQHSLVVLQKKLPKFRLHKDDRRYFECPSRFPMNTAYTEGWGLYSEELGLEMGLYDTLQELYGYYISELYRSARIVVNVGIHALGWTEPEAIQFLKNNTALSDEGISTEMNRHVMLPGQQCAYKMGHFKIRELRRRAEKELGPDFDIRDFHDACLTCGQVPLQVLEKIIDHYIEDTKNSQ